MTTSNANTERSAAAANGSARSPTAKIVSDLQACGERLAAGELVAFPTETVYGLGCHALDTAAVHKIFAAKERPLTDPLIVHVLDADDAFQLWKFDKNTKDNAENTLAVTVLETLCKHFWPGPLTLVAEADTDVVPSTIMAGTGYCACRSPSHQTARDLMATCRLPLAAPSANKFGHVSPTTAQHVWDDLQYEDVWILQDDDHEQTTSTTTTTTTCCNVGVESTVAKLEMVSSSSDDTDNVVRAIVTVLRQGAVSVAQMQAVLQDLPVQVLSKTKQATPDTVAHVAPGQTIRHYSPNIPSFQLSPACIRSMAKMPTTKMINGVEEEKKTNSPLNGIHVSTTAAAAAMEAVLPTAVVIDYGGQLADCCQHAAAAYRDLSPTADSAQAAQSVFETLRWAEQVPAARCIVFPQQLVQRQKSDENNNNQHQQQEDALALAVRDRLTRAASGVVIDCLSAIVEEDGVDTNNSATTATRIAVAAKQASQ